MTTGERIREIRRDQNISQTQLAQAAGLNQPQVSAIEGGRVKPSVKTIERIATALHVPVENITNEQPKPDPTFTPYQIMLIYKAIQHRIDEEINRLADGMEVDKSEVLRVWEEHKDVYCRNKAGGRRSSNNHRSGGERGMNHDATHCDDYKVNKCPKKCYRAQLTQDLRERHDLFFVPISWAHFKGTEECPLSKKVSE